MKTLTIGVALLALAVAVTGCTKNTPQAKKPAATTEHKVMKPAMPATETKAAETKKSEAAAPVTRSEAEKAVPKAAEKKPEQKPAANSAGSDAETPAPADALEAKQ
jgi:hypothetical protein